MGKYAFVHRTIELWNWLPAEALAAFTSKSHIIRKRFRRAIISEEKWGVFEAWWRNIQKCRDVKNGEWSVVQCSAAKRSEVRISGEMCVLSSIYIYEAVCWFCTVRCPLLFVSICHFLITRLMFLNILFRFVLYFVYSVFFVFFV
jgi:hypothetical protein